MRKKEKDIFSRYFGKKGITMWGVLFFLILGISIGAFSEKMMDISQKNELLTFVNTYFNVMHLDNIPVNQIFIKSLLNNFKLLGVVFLSGATVIGFPIAILALTFRGITIGFAVAFFMEEMKLKGLMLSTFSILPQNLIFIPASVIATTVSVGFAFSFLFKKGNPTSNNIYLQQVTSYLSVFILIGVAFFFGCLIESYICPILIKLIVSI